MCEGLTTPNHEDTPHSWLTRIGFSNYDRVSSDFTGVLKGLYMSLMPDFYMRKMFALSYSRHVLKMHDGVNSDWYDSLTVQFLTVPSVVNTYQRPNRELDSPGLFHAITQALAGRIKHLLQPIEGYRGIRFDVDGLSTASRLILDKGAQMAKCVGLINDFVMCLRPDTKHAWYCLNTKELVDRALYHMLVLQQSFACLRIDSDAFNSMNIKHELKLAAVNERLSEGVVHAVDVADIKKLIAAITRFIDVFLSNVLTNRPIEPGLPWLYMNNIYGNSEHGAYFQLSLHRFLSNVIQKAVQCHPTLDIKEYFPEDFVKDISNYLESTITVELAKAQVLAGMWRRNHMGIEYQTDWYSSITSLQPSFLIPDLFLLQIGAAMGPTALTIQLAHRFSSHQPLITPEPGAAREHDVLDSFLRLILVIATDRTRSAPHKKTWLYHRLVHGLAGGPKKFSELVSVYALSDDDDKDEPLAKVLEDLLKDCADSTDGPEGRRFSLKKECWKDVNPYESGWPETTTSKADAEFAKSNSGRNIIPCQKPSSPYPSLAPIIGILHNEVTLSIAIAALACKTETTTRKALDIVLLALQTADDYKAAWSICAKSESRFYGCKRGMAGVVELIPPTLQWEVTNDSPDIAKLLTTPSDGTMPLDRIIDVLHQPSLKDMHCAVRDIVDMVKRQGDEYAKLIESLDEKLNPKDQTSGATKARKAKGKAKQKAALSKMQQQQSKLDFEFSEDEDDEGEQGEAERDTLHNELDVGWIDESKCSLCNMVESPHGNTDIGLVALVSKGTALQGCFTPVRGSPPTKKAKYEEGDEFSHEFCSPMNEGKGHTIVHTCGHFVHFDCLDSHIRHIRNSATIAGMLREQNQLLPPEFKGVDVLDLRLNEFLCPLCSRICNTLCPIIVPQGIGKRIRQQEFPLLLTQKPEEEGDLSRADAEIESLCRNINDDIELCGEESVLPDDEAAFIHRIFSFRKNICEKQFRGDEAVTTGTPMVLWAQQVAITEIASRFDKGDTAISTRKLASLRTQLKAILVAQQYEITTLNAFRSFLHLEGEPESVRPLLACDVFGVWVQVLINVTLRCNDLRHAGHRFLMKRAIEAQVVALILRLLNSGHAVEDKALSVIVQTLAPCVGKSVKMKKPDFDVVDYIAREMCVFLSWLVIADYTITAPLAADNLVLPSFENPKEAMKQIATRLPVGDEYGSVEGIAQAILSYDGELGNLDGWVADLEARPCAVPAPYCSLGKPHIIDLPNDYVSLVNKYIKVKGKCGNVPARAVLCLACGEIVCYAAKCCKVGKKGPCVVHAEQCGLGQCLFLEIRSTRLIAFDLPRKCIIPSVYTDSYGEDDLDLTRGRPLFLNKARVERIERIAALSMYGFDTSIIENTVVNTSTTFNDVW
eukprot:TRINITY_DN9616_c0_g1_i1.p1 TRINITY_DN9616_c0_g1~~TRINITY_DN9616_c0_g1_i1.p1  ORF type:complete len:1605 (+),score=439.31 TRINITY_DN9616_c0_g1_i1:649-4815(+)